MAIDLGKHLRPVMRRAALAALLLGAALPAAAETLGDTMVAAYRHSALLDQQRAVLRATDEDVATAMAGLAVAVATANGKTSDVHLHAPITVTQPNVTVETSGIARITPTTIVTQTRNWALP